MPLRAITPAVVREWYAAALRGTGGRTSIQQSYRFLRAVMNTAVRDGAITKNPCNIPGAGTDRAKGITVTEKRKVGGSTPPLTTSCEQAKRPGGSLRPGRLTATVTATTGCLAISRTMSGPRPGAGVARRTTEHGFVIPLGAA